MGLFGRTRSPVAAPAEVEAWRGRGRELPDAGPVSWQVLFAGLETVPPALRDPESPVGALGFATTEHAGRWEHTWTTGLSGTRHGRQVEIRLGARDHGWSAGGAMVTWVRVAAPDLRALGGRGGTFAVDPSPDPRAGRVLAGLAAVPAVWDGVRLRGGAEGLVAARRMSPGSHSQGYLYDLWLLERLADVLNAPALPPVDVAGVPAPYRMG
jgi:hypothetical protein